MSKIFNVSYISTGFVAVLIGYASAAAIIFQAATNLGLNDAQITSWFWALGIGMSVTTIVLSWFYRIPILIVWSTPGAALLVTAVSDLTLAQAVGVFFCSSLLIVVTGLTGAIDRLLNIIPGAIANAMLAGVLLQFGLQVFTEFTQQIWLVGPMLLAFFILKPLSARYAIPWTLLVGFLAAIVFQKAEFSNVSWALSGPVWETPEFDFPVIIGVALPLYLVTMASQNLPGLAVLQAHGYRVAASPIITTTGVMGLIMAPFGGFAFNLAAITAAICMGKEVDSDPALRYRAALWSGVFSALAGVFAAAVVGVFIAVPHALVAALAGLALIPTIGTSLKSALIEDQYKEAATVTFLVTASGISVFGISSAFWGLVAGILAARWWRS